MNKWIPEIVINDCKDAICKPISLREVLGDGKYFNNTASIKKARGFIRTKDGEFHIVEKELNMGWLDQYEFIPGTDIAMIHINVEYTATLNNGLTVTVCDKLCGNYDRKVNVLDLWSIEGHTFQVLIEEDADDEPMKNEEPQEDFKQITTNNNSECRILEYHTATVDCIHNYNGVHLFDAIEKHDNMKIETINVNSEKTNVYSVSEQNITKLNSGIIAVFAKLVHKINGKIEKIYGKCTEDGVLSLASDGKDVRSVTIGFTVSHPKEEVCHEEKEIPNKLSVVERSFLMGLHGYDILVKDIKMGIDEIDLFSGFINRDNAEVSLVTIVAISSSSNSIFENNKWEGLEEQETSKSEFGDNRTSISVTVENGFVNPNLNVTDAALISSLHTKDTIYGEYSKDGKMFLNSRDNVVESVIVVVAVKIHSDNDDKKEE